MKSLALIILLLIGSTIIKFAQVNGGNFPFTMDQGRDMVDLRHMVVTYSPRLVGPTTSINGVLLGPFWYYFNLPAFIIGGGNPTSIVYWQIIWYQIAVVTLWLVLKKHSTVLANITALTLFLMPTGFNVARYFWNANSMPIFTIFFFASLIHTIANKSPKNLLILGIISGLSMQVEAAFGILFFPFAFLYFAFIKTKLKQILMLALGFLVTLLPQVLFELRHGFIMTKIFLSEFSGSGTMLGSKMEFGERLIQRKEHLVELVFRTSHLPPNYLSVLFWLSILAFAVVSLRYIKKSSYQTKVWHLAFYFMAFSGAFYLVFPQTLKIWYSLGFSIPLAIYFSSFLSNLYEKKNILAKVFIFAVLTTTVYYAFKSQIDYTRVVAWSASDDRSNMRNETAALDWVYQNAEGKGFNAYSYLPSVYDFPYNHLYWWYGQKKYGYQPNEVAYLPNQPEYIADIDKLWLNKKAQDATGLTFLIIEDDVEMPQRTQAWLGNFSKYCTIKEHVFPWRTTVKMISPCQSADK